MNRFNPGDIITFPLRGDMYGVAKIVHVENLALHDNYHMVVYDQLVEGGEESFDEFGHHSRTHDFNGVAAPVVIDHIALTEEAFLASAPVKVGEQDVSDEELAGYHIWLQLRYQEAVRHGLMRERSDEDEADDEADQDEYQTVDAEEHDESDDADEDSAGEESEEASEEPVREITLQRWHHVTYDYPLDKALFEAHDKVPAPEGAEASTLGDYLASHFGEGNEEAINELIARFLSGDYGAGHELLDFGDPAADALAETLSDDVDPELADDILRLCTEMGVDRGYEHVVAFLEKHTDLQNDPLALPAARNYCYAVMLTGGDPAPLRPYLDKIDQWDHPELEDDLRMAREAVENTPRTDEPSPSSKPSSDPFGL
jgi:hypothetical protein